MVINRSVIELGEGKVVKPRECLINRPPSSLNIFQQGSQ